MASLADELSAATSGEDKGYFQIEANITEVNQDLENNRNINNTSYSTETNKVPTQFNKFGITQQSASCFNEYDMDITCDVTIPVMNKEKYPEIREIESRTLQDISVDNTIVEKSVRLSSDKQIDTTSSDVEITTMQDDVTSSIKSPIISKNIFSASVDHSSIDSEAAEEYSSCLWTQISTDFDPEEETVNFGTRYALEKDGKLFDVFTFATIEPKVIKLRLFLKQNSHNFFNNLYIYQP